MYATDQNYEPKPTASAWQEFYARLNAAMQAAMAAAAACPTGENAELAAVCETLETEMRRAAAAIDQDTRAA